MTARPLMHSQEHWAEKRQYPRLADGIAVHLGEHRLRVINWSADGLALAVDQHTALWRAGTTVSLKISIPFDNFSYSFSVEALVLRQKEGCWGLQFRALNAHHRTVLSNLVAAKITKAPLTLEVLRVVPEVDTPPPPPLTKQQTFWHYAGNLALIPATVLVILFALFTLDWHLYRDKADYAIIIAPSYTVQAPVDGTVEFSLAPDTFQVHKGQRLAHVRSSVLEERLALLAIQLEKQRHILSAYAAQQASFDTFLTHYQKIADAEFSAQDEEANYLQKQEKRLRDLHKKGYIADSTLDKIHSEAAQASAQMRIAMENKALAKEGFYYSGSRVEGGQDSRWRRDYALAQAEYDALIAEEEGLKRLQESYALISPCDCRIGQRLQAQKTIAKQGDSLFTLYDINPKALHVVALLTPEALQRTQLGDAVLLHLPDGSTATGTVRDLLPMGAPIPVPVSFRHLSAIVAVPDAPLPSWHDVPVRAEIDRRRQNPLAFWRPKPDFAPRLQKEFVLSDYPAKQK